MATTNVLKRSKGKASILGTTILTVPASTVITIIGCRLANLSAGDRTFYVQASSTYVSGANTELPVGSAIDIMSGSKIVLTAGDTLKAFSDTDNSVDVYISYLEQTTV